MTAAETTTAKSLTRGMIVKRLEMLHADLELMSAETPCSWSVARVFNELLKQTRQELPTDPVVPVISVLRRPDEHESAAADVGTVRALLGQLIAALQDDGVHESPQDPAAASEIKAQRSATRGSARRDPSRAPS